MKVNPRYYPLILIVTFAAFLVLALLLGLQPGHGGGHGGGRAAWQAPLHLSMCLGGLL